MRRLRLLCKRHKVTVTCIHTWSSSRRQELLQMRPLEEIRTRCCGCGIRFESSAHSSFQMSQSQPETDLPTKAASLFRNLDVFPKVADEARARSASGGATTLSVALCILVLVVTEARLYSSIRTDQTLEVDVSRGGKIAVDFNITFHHLPCSLMSVDSMDISGNWFILQQWL